MAAPLSFISRLIPRLQPPESQPFVLRPHRSRM